MKNLKFIFGLLMTIGLFLGVLFFVVSIWTFSSFYFKLFLTCFVGYYFFGFLFGRMDKNFVD
jgi:hypothetical protein